MEVELEMIRRKMNEMEEERVRQVALKAREEKK